MGGAVAAAAAAATQAREKVISHFMAANAVSADQAIAFTPARSIEERQYQQLKNAGVIKLGARGDYIDIPAYDAWRRSNGKRQATATLIAVGFALVLAGVVLVSLAHRSG